MVRIFFFLFLWCTQCIAQNYSFIPKEFTEIKDKDFFKIASSDTLKLVKVYLEKFFVNESKKQFYIVYKELSEIERKQQAIEQKVEITNNRKKYKLQEGTVLKELNFKDNNGNSFTLDSLKGKVIVLNFWFTTCRPCVEEIPDLNRIQEKFKEKEVVFLAVTFDSKKKLEEFVKKKPFNFTLVPDSMKIIRQFYVNSYPTTILIDKDRKIHLIDDLLVFDLMNKIEKMIKNYL
ncbi:peroxiredoxin family protein [Flavobacterium sp.]|jgi:peroxiredoxin|uniref:peroxiredoxin family protein n=1 Tax=Flavobacterium sp. TaxID=239 RepID=UPI0037BEF6CE